MSISTPETVWTRYAFNGASDIWERDSTVNVPGVFDWLLKDEEIGKIIDDEFLIYHHHYFPLGG